MDFKFSVGEEVEIKMVFAMPTTGGVNTPGFTAKVYRRDDTKGEPRYMLRGFSGWWKESTLFKIPQR